MKIKNDLVRIELGKRKFDFKNLIMDEYLKRLKYKQINASDLVKRGYILLCDTFYIKFDTALTFDATSQISSSSFDIITTTTPLITENLSPNNVTINYTQTLYKQRLTSYIGKKITAIGFKSGFNTDDNGNPIYMFAILDTSKYNIYIQSNEDLTITRKDIISTDAIFYSSNIDKVSAPAHLAPLGLPNILEQQELVINGLHYNYKNECYGILDSVGYGYNSYQPKELHSPVFYTYDPNLLLNENLTNKNTGYDGDFPQMDYPQMDYPSAPRYKYIILKYKVYQVIYTYDSIDNEIIQTPTDTGEYYFQAFPIDIYGNAIRIKYERG